MISAIINGVEVKPVELHVDKEILDEIYLSYSVNYEKDLINKINKDEF